MKVAEVMNERVGGGEERARGRQERAGGRGYTADPEYC